MIHVDAFRQYSLFGYKDYDNETINVMPIVLCGTTKLTIATLRSPKYRAMFSPFIFLLLCHVNGLLEIPFNEENDFITLPATYTAGRSSYEIISAPIASYNGYWNLALEVKIENFEPEREICFDDFLDIRDNGGSNSPLLWGICTKKLREKRIISCGNSIQYKQDVVLDHDRMQVSIRAIVDDGTFVKPFLCQHRKLPLKVVNI